MYELFILSKLLHRPMHGYLIQAILNSAVGPFRKVSWGTLYPLIKKLQKAGYIAAVDETVDDARGKKRYRTTKAGRERFLALIHSYGEYDADSPDLFSLKVGCFGHLDVNARISVLKDHRNYLRLVIAHCQAMMSRVESENNLPPEEHRFALLALEHKKAVTKSEMRWIDCLLGRPERVAPMTS
jgi:DNA-binding PadR family transcriptional regulator